MEKSLEKLQITCNVYEPKELFSFAFLSNADRTMQNARHADAFPPDVKFPFSKQKIVSRLSCRGLRLRQNDI